MAPVYPVGDAGGRRRADWVRTSVTHWQAATWRDAWQRTLARRGETVRDRLRRRCNRANVPDSRWIVPGSVAVPQLDQSYCIAWLDGHSPVTSSSRKQLHRPLGRFNIVSLVRDRNGVSSRIGWRTRSQPGCARSDRVHRVVRSAH